MNEEATPQIGDIPIIMPEKKPSKFAVLESRLNEQAEAIGILSRAIQELHKGLQTTQAAAPPSSMEPIPAGPGTSNSREFLNMMQAFMQMQGQMIQNMNLLKQGTLTDITAARNLLEFGGSDDDYDGEDSGDPLMDVVGQVAKQYLAAKNSGSVGSPPPAPTPSPFYPQAIIEPGKPAPDLTKPAPEADDLEDDE